MAQSNINSMYEELTYDLAERAKLIHEEQPELDHYECVNQAIDEGFIYGCDEAYAVAHYMINGGFKIGEQVDWDDFWSNFLEDVVNDFEEMLKQWEGARNRPTLSRAPEHSDSGERVKRPRNWIVSNKAPEYRGFVVGGRMSQNIYFTTLNKKSKKVYSIGSARKGSQGLKYGLVAVYYRAAKSDSNLWKTPKK